MALEAAPFINGLAPANPPGSDRIHQGDDHIRLIKSALKNTFPNLTGAVTKTQAELNATAFTMPVGIIAIWYGLAVDCPAGWQVCDGSTVPRSDLSGNITVPDLRSRVVVGCDDSLTPGDTFGAADIAGTSTAASGTHGHTGSAATAGEHSHGGATGTLALGGSISTTTHTVDGSGGYSVVSGVTYTGPAPHSHTIDPSGGHTHVVTLDGAGSHTHTVPTFSVLQPSMALHHIMKI